MKRIYLNLKRFDIPREMGGINDTGMREQYARKIVSDIEKLSQDFMFTVFFQEAYVLPATDVAKRTHIGCQGVYEKDVEKGGNFGGMTTFRTAKSMKALGVDSVIIGHCEERAYLNGILSAGGGQGDVNEILNREIRCAVNAGMNVLYCIGEKSEEQQYRFDVLTHQLETGLKDVDLTNVAIAYEPVWAIGVGKIPPDRQYIEEIVEHVKSVYNLPVVSGGGLKEQNAEMLAGIEKLDGGLIALTRFGSDFGFYLEDFNKIVETYQGGLK